ncbi:MAG: P-II family nitrogen regulator [Candidatus Nitrosopelagicus brevis]|nr:P-II family nitrogen regulator [Candidatus Nitrosopelagicus brevis]
MLKLEIILSENDVMSISEGFKQIDIGGLTITKVRGRGEKTAPEILVHKGSEVFVPHFGDKYRIMVVIPESKEEKAVNIIKNNSRGGKIFISQLLRAIDIKTGNEGEEIIDMKLSLPKNNIKISNLTRADYMKLVVIGGIVVVPPVALAIIGGI